MFQAFVRLCGAPPDKKSFWHSISDGLPTIQEAFDALNVWLAWRAVGSKSRGIEKFGGGFFDERGNVRVMVISVEENQIKAFLEGEDPDVLTIRRATVNISEAVPPAGPLLVEV